MMAVTLRHWVPSSQRDTPCKNTFYSPPRPEWPWHSLGPKYYTDRLLSQPEDSFSVATVDHEVRDSRVTG